MKKPVMLSMLTVALALGTAWAVRGKFGHEQGAAWAGGIGAMALVLAAKRGDWYNKILTVALAGAFGWGVGGMISYGVVVGYGRGSDFGNVYYGLAMLFVIGALYGFLGGGMVGLALADSQQSKVKWPGLLTGMVAWGVATYAFLIDQLEWLMTPPRSEMWAACLGASIALGWYVVRNRHAAVLKVAVWSALGAGFGFAFGNFLQVLNATLQIKMNFWNVMEYAIGFFGGLGMAYGVFTSEWPVSKDQPTKPSNLLPLLLLVVFIPFVIWDQSFVASKMEFILKEGYSASTIVAFQWVAAVSMIVIAMVFFARYYKAGYTYSDVRTMFILYMVLYTFLSFLQTGIYTHPVEQYLYLVNIAAILALAPGLKDNFSVVEERPARWGSALLVVVAVLALLAWLLIQSHGELKNSQIRFPL